jgi:glycosyltransferase involved in cell wall biosynthesis
MSRVSAIIPSLASETTRPYLKLCVESLRASVDWDIIVVTNGTKTPEPLDIKGITTRLHTRDQGQNNAVNIGAQIATGDYLFVINDDMYFTPGWNRNLRFDDLCFSPNLVEPENNNGSANPFLKYPGKGFTLDEFEKNLVDMFMEKKRDEVHDESYRKENGFNLPFFIRRDIFNEVGGYDVAYDPWGSNGDTDLQTKIELSGSIPKRLRDVLVYHFSNKSDTFKPENQVFWQHNWDYYTEKWGFNRDQTNGDPWYCKSMIDYDKLKYKPSWIGKYEDWT